MELIKNIFFNTDKLTPFSNVKITYAGELFNYNFQNNTYIHYTFNNEWDKAIDIEMKKSELGYQVEIPIKNESNINMCFYNEKKEWDNNNNNNYNFNIEKIELNLTLINNKSLSQVKKFSKFYLWKKRISNNLYKIFTFIPKLITGKFKRKIL